VGTARRKCTLRHRGSALDRKRVVRQLGILARCKLARRGFKKIKSKGSILNFSACSPKTRFLSPCAGAGICQAKAARGFKGVRGACCG